MSSPTNGNLKPEENREQPEEEEPNWTRILIRDEFLKLYFDNLGVDEKLTVERMTNYYDIGRKKNEDKFQFAIIRTKIIEKDDSKEKDKKTKDGHFIMYPADPKKYDDSINFLSLAYSGFCMLDKDSCLLKEEEKAENPHRNKKLLKFIQRLKKSKSINSDQLDQVLKRDKEISSEHNRYSKEVFENRLDKIPTTKKDNYSYSLFYRKDNKLYEFRGHSKKISQEGESNVSQAKSSEALLNYIVSENEKKEKKYEYLHDVTIFNELSKIEEEEITETNMGEVLLILLMTALFILNFFIVVPQQNFYNLRSTFQQLLEQDKTGASVISELTTMNQIKTFLLDTFLTQNIYNTVVNKFNYSDISSSGNSIIESSNSTSNTVLLQLEREKYYLLNTNFFSGLSINFKRVNMQTILDINGEPQTIMQSKIAYFEAEPIYSQESFLSFDNASKNPLYPNTYELYLKPTLNENQLQWYKQQLDPIFDDRLNSIAVTLVVYNADFSIFSVYSLNFQFNSYGELTYERYFNGFLPFLNLDRTTFINLLVIQIFMVIIFSYFFFITIRSFSNHLVELVNNRNYTFEWYEWVDMIVCIFMIVSTIMFYWIYLFNFTSIDISIAYSENFTYLINLAFVSQDYRRVTGLCMLLMMFRVIRYLYTNYPSFGVVFQTLQQAYVEFFSFILVVGLVLIGIIMMAHNSFGWYSLPYEQIEYAAISIYLMFLGMFNYTDLYSSTFGSSLAPVFFIVFMFLFHLILINVFFCIIRNNYYEVKDKKERSNQAYSLIAADLTEDFYKRLSNLVFFRNPIEVEEEMKEEKKKEEEEENPGREVQPAEQGEIAAEEEGNEVEQKKKKNEASLIKIFIYHVVRLNLKEFFFGSSNLNREEVIKKKNEKYKEIRRQQVMESVEELTVDYEAEFDQLIDTFCFGIFIIIFTLMIFSQARIGTSIYAIKSVRDQINAVVENNVNFFSFEEAAQPINQIMDKLYNGVYDKEGNFDTSLCSDSPHNTYNTFNENALNYYFPINPPYMRLTYRYLDFPVNTNVWEDQYFPLNVGNNQPLNSQNCPGNHEYTKDLTFQDASYSSTFYASYISVGNTTAINKCGGFVYYTGVKHPRCETAFKKNYTTYSYFMLQNNLGSLNMDMGVFSMYFDYAMYFTISIVRVAMGRLNFSIDYSMVPINRYVTSRDFSRLILEIIYYAFVIYYFCVEFSEVYTSVRKELVEDYKKATINDKRFEDSSPLNKFIRFDIEKYKKETGLLLLFKLVFEVFFLVISKAIQIGIIILNSFFGYLKKDFYNIFDCFSIILSFAMFVLWINIINLTTSMNFVFSKVMPDPLPDMTNIEILNQLANYYDNYCFWQAINTILIFLRMLQYFKFSKSIYSLILLLKRVAANILFHLLLMMIIFLGFAFFGYAIYCENMSLYSTLNDSLLSLIVFLSGKGASLTDYYTTDPTMTSFFIVLFTGIFLLILLNVLFSIIIESYKDIQHRQKQNLSETERHNFFQNIYAIVSIKYRIFFHTLNLYTFNLSYSDEQYIQKCRRIYEEGIRDTKQELSSEKTGKKGFCQKVATFNALSIRYLNDVESEVSQVEEATVKGVYIEELKNPDLLKQRLEEEENLRAKKKEELVKLNLAEEENEEDKPQFSCKISIWMKMMTYIQSFILEITEENFIKKEFLISKKDTEIMKTKTFQFVEGNILTDEDSKNEEDKEEKMNAFESNLEKNPYLKLLHDSFRQKMLYIDNAYFKSNLFEKFLTNNFILEQQSQNHLNNQNNQHTLNKSLTSKKISPVENLRFSKESRVHSNMITHDQIFFINQINFDSIHNLNFNFTCQKEECVEVRGMCCPNCSKIKEYFDSLSILVYDMMLKNFYFPNDASADGKEIYTAYYLYQFHLACKNITDIKYLFKKVPEFKKKNFEKEIQFLRSMEEFCPFTINDLREKNGGILDVPQEVKLNCVLKENFKESEFASEGDHLQFKELFKLYKFLTIWNTIYIVLFDKNKYFTRALRDKSQSFKLLNTHVDEDNEGISQSPFKNFFIQMFKLKDRKFELKVENSHSNNTFMNHIINLLRQDKLNIGLNDYEQEDSDEKIFGNSEIYLLKEPNVQELYEEVMPKDKPFIMEHDSNYPFIFSSLWESFSKKEKFTFFYGYNTLIFDSNFKINNLLLPTFFLDYNTCLDCFDFMHSIHQAQVFSFKDFPKPYIDLLKMEIHKAIEKNLIQDSQKIENVKHMKDVFKYFAELKVNYLISHEILQNSFKAYLKNAKSVSRKISEQFRTIFMIINGKNRTLDSTAKKNEFVKFYQLYITKIKFYKLSEYFANRNVNDDSDYVNLNDEEENEDELAKSILQKANEVEIIDDLVNFENSKVDKIAIEIGKTAEPENEALSDEIFIFALSFAPTDYLDAIRKIQDSRLREFHLFLFQYLYADDPDYDNYIYYLNKRIKVTMSEKLLNYAQYYKEREEVYEELEEYNKQKKFLVDNIAYMKKQYDIIEKLSAKKENLIKKYNAKLEEEKA